MIVKNVWEEQFKTDCAIQYVTLTEVRSHMGPLLDMVFSCQVCFHTNSEPQRQEMIFTRTPYQQRVVSPLFKELASKTILY